LTLPINVAEVYMLRINGSLSSVQMDFNCLFLLYDHKIDNLSPRCFGDFTTSTFNQIREYNRILNERVAYLPSALQ